MEAGLVAAAFSLATLALARCRCVVKRENEQMKWGVAFSDQPLFPQTPEPPVAVPNE